MMSICGRIMSFKKLVYLVVLFLVALCIIMISALFQQRTTATRYSRQHHLSTGHMLVTSPENNIEPQSEIRHIAFLKVHKAASTTAQNIFLRFALRRDLLVVVPHVPKFFYPNIISTGSTVNSKNILPPPANRSYEILCCHVFYHREAFARIMPRDTVYIGILREPFEHFISVLNYFQPKNILNINSTHPVSTYLQSPTSYERIQSRSYTNNRMATEYNFPSQLYETRNKTGIEDYLRKLDKEFQLILIVELFDESLVLMRRLLNWNIHDILYVKKNVKKHLNEKITFQSGDVDLYRRWAALDYGLYDYFYRRLQNQINAQRPDFYEELLYFKRLRRDMEFFCAKALPIKKQNTLYDVADSPWSPSFAITQDDCKYMYLGEIPFIREVRTKQYGYFNETV